MNVINLYVSMWARNMYLLSSNSHYLHYNFEKIFNNFTDAWHLFLSLSMFVLKNYCLRFYCFLTFSNSGCSLLTPDISYIFNTLIFLCCCHFGSVLKISLKSFLLIASNKFVFISLKDLLPEIWELQLYFGFFSATICWHLIIWHLQYCDWRSYNVGDILLVLLFQWKDLH